MCITGFFNFSFRVMEKDPFHANCLPVHIGTLVELNKANGKEHRIQYTSTEGCKAPVFIKN